ncbi:fasciclin-like arabinogalactan protein 3 [Gastrolobium bilobum]|uniref:fasciclin-like arabinogalactan protein 3 n=1 Tax=Gastrolobium bilobum TaxID=150636 RepID=UPI002AB0166B|nr:fasciclin-like arabinogalactan protein 3 [Gastrolobium bilobum]
MGLRNSWVLCLALMLTFSSAIHGLDITKLLSQYPEFSQFNKYLTETKLAEQINSGKKVTILALDNKALSSLSGKSQETIKAIIGTHVLPDYYDEKKLVEAQGSHTKLQTLFGASGAAKNDQGYIYVNLINEGEVAFASAVEGSPYKTLLVNTVTNQPETVAVLQVTEPIVAPGVESSSSSSSPVVENEESLIAESPAEAPAPSSSSRTQVMGFVGVVMALASFFVSF